MKDLLERLARQEQALKDTVFLAPQVPGGCVRLRQDRLIHEFRTEPREFEGWGIFRVRDAVTAIKVEEADFAQVDRYLEKLPRMQLILTFPLKGKSWLAFPLNRSDALQRLGCWQMVRVDLVERAQAFDVVQSRFDGRQFWYENEEGDPALADRLRECLREEVFPEALQLRDLTPEFRAAYGAVVRRIENFGVCRDEVRLRDALRTGGGELLGFVDHHRHWAVEWRDSQGAVRYSAIAKDLSVVSAGICLSGLDDHFDLQSLVGVVEYSDE